MSQSQLRTSRSRRITAAIALALSAAVLAPIPAAHAVPAHVGRAPARTGAAFTVTEDLGNATATLTIDLDPPAPSSDGTPPARSDADIAQELAKLTEMVAAAPAPASDLSAEERAVLEADVVSPEEPEPDAATGPTVAAAKGGEVAAGQDPGGGSPGRGVLKCYDNRSWTDARGTFSARHNCAYSNINWGYKISPAMQAVISSPVRETGLRWWRNGKSQPANSPHTVGKSYLFHGTIGPVASWDAIDYQDYMTFSVNVGGRPGRGTLTFAGGLVPLRG
ncbi:hypothetical protein F7Q99_31410 [Streptomyces kaniharaensis]|uniref:Secreted protein n=1 Tax=Streptomyces kaniharaensis TaxID=212423 RepID=A0A6N7L1K5_9ACTN|nr:hypothetical protein [Streptomyces kaniharaensis]MQS16577.1 hypothetical protein [Streptomyces kaniharaensis]